MRSRRTVLFFASAALLVAPAAGAESVEEQMKQMQERMLQMEDRLRATEDQLEVAEAQVEEQSELLESAGFSEGRGVGNGLTDFVNSLKVGGWVAASWAYNFNGLDGAALGGGNAGAIPIYPHHPDTNSFSIDEFWLELEREVSVDHRAGFRIDLAYGKTAGILSGNGGPNGIAGDDLELYQAYVQYLAPIGNGVRFQFGKFGTLIGAEVAPAPYSFNITRGNLYQLFQPITHTGILASTEIAGLSLSIGGVNETRAFDARDIDFNNGKALLWGMGYELGDFGLNFAGTYGSADSGSGLGTPNTENNDELILDFIASWDPTDNFSTYVNFDYIETQNAQLDITPSLGGGAFEDIHGFGVAWAGRYGLTDRTGISIRTEYVELDNFFTSEDDLELWSATATIDHLLTKHLMVRGEVRYDTAAVTGGPLSDDVFIGNDEFSQDDQVVLLLEAIYKFDGFGD